MAPCPFLLSFLSPLLLFPFLPPSVRCLCIPFLSRGPLPQSSYRGSHVGSAGPGGVRPTNGFWVKNHVSRDDAIAEVFRHHAFLWSIGLRHTGLVFLTREVAVCFRVNEYGLTSHTRHMIGLGHLGDEYFQAIVWVWFESAIEVPAYRYTVPLPVHGCVHAIVFQWYISVISVAHFYPNQIKSNLFFSSTK